MRHTHAIRSSAALGGHGRDYHGSQVVVHFGGGHHNAWARLLISLPIVGSRLTSQISPRITRPVPHPPRSRIHPAPGRHLRLRRSSLPLPPTLHAAGGPVCAARERRP